VRGSFRRLGFPKIVRFRHGPLEDRRCTAMRNRELCEADPRLFAGLLIAQFENMTSVIYKRQPLIFPCVRALMIFAAACACIAEDAAATPNSLLSPLVKKMGAAVEVERSLATMRHVYSTDRWFTFPKFEETALYLKQRLEESGVISVEIGGAHADGKSQAGFWTMPLAWDAKAARLELISPEREVLCDYESIPASLGMWSASTPPGGTTAELVDQATTSWANVKGKLVLTEVNSAGLKYELVRNGALGAVNGFSENPALEDGRQWINAWGDNGWGFTKASTPLLSFSVTARQAKHLRELLKSGRVMLHATADTRYYEGRYPWVTGLLPGSDRGEEVLVLGHTSEQGAQDNATGVSAMVEAVHTIAQLVETGKLPRPRRSIRILLMPEMYGSLSYISANAERMRHTVAAMTVDTPAAPYDLAGTEYTFYMNPHVAMSYTDALMQRIAGTYLSPSRPWHWSEHMPGTDTYLGEPTIGVPTDWPYSGTGPVTHHNSEDKPEAVDPRSMRDLVTTIATYLYFNASAGEQQIPWLGQITFDHLEDEVRCSVEKGVDAWSAGDQAAGSYAIARVRYFADRGRDAIASVLRLAPAEHRVECRRKLDPLMKQLEEFCQMQVERLREAGIKEIPEKQIPGAAEIVVHRKRIGTIPLDDLARDQWEGYPSGAWDKLVTVALYWCDGKRNLAEVAHLTAMEMGPTDLDFVGYFRFLERHGYVEFTK